MTSNQACSNGGNHAEPTSNGPSFPAFDPQGNPHAKQRIPSDTASQASTVVPAKNSNWAKPAGRRVEPKMAMLVVPPARGYESDSEDEIWTLLVGDVRIYSCFALRSVRRINIGTFPSQALLCFAAHPI
jgi:hypothetical protein